MGKRTFQCSSWAPTATANNVALANNTHQSLTANNTTSGCLVQEIEIGGQASASAVMIMLWSRNNVLVTTPTFAFPFTDGPMTGFGGLTTAGVLPSNLAGTPGQRSNNVNAGVLNLTFNAFGGIVRWQAAPFEEWGILGTAGNLSESSLSGFTGTAVANIGSHIIYEPFNT